jgi:DNA polymerase-3 subunit alpha
MTEFYTFDCGCKFKILDPKIKEYDGLPSIEVDFDNIPLKCGKTWDLLCDADTKGIFQLEKSGQSWAKQVKPRSITELSDLISIIRPGVTQSKIEDKSLTNHYIDRKFKREEVKYEEPILEPILTDTQGILVYQEQAIRIARDVAGFTMEEADSLRKSIGKKDAQLMTKVETMFLDGCKKTGIVNEESAKQIFGWIRESQKYSFNKCLHPDSIVETPDGFKTLQEIKIGDKVLAPKNEKEDEFVNVVNKYNNGEKELYEFTTESGNTVVCTLDHKFLCEDGLLYPLWEIIHENLKIMCKD